MGGRRRAVWGVLAAPLLFWLVFYLGPVAELAGLVIGDPALRGPGFGRDLAQALKIFRFTFWQAAVSAILALALAWPAALCWGRFAFPGRDLFLKLSLIAFVLPTVVVGAMFRALGNWEIFPEWLTRNGPWAIIAAHVYYNFPLALVSLTLAREALPPHYYEAARTLGAGPGRLWAVLTWPLMWPAVRAAGLMVFMFCFLSFGVALILGDLSSVTLEVAIYRAALFELDLGRAGLLAVGQVLVSLAVFSLFRASERRGAGAGKFLKRPERLSAKIALGISLALVTAVLAAPPLLMLWSSIDGRDGPTLAFWRAAFQPGPGIFEPRVAAALGRSLAVALSSAALTTVLAVLTVLGLLRLKGRARQLTDSLLSLSWVTSAVVLGLALSLYFNRWPASFRDGVPGLALVHSLVAWPLVARLLWPALSAWPVGLVEAARTLGAGPRAYWLQVILPLMARPLGAALTLAALISLGEFGASSFMVRGTGQTLTTAMGFYLGRAGALNHGRAMVMGSILLFTIVILSLLAIKLGAVGNSKPDPYRGPPTGG